MAQFEIENGILLGYNGIGPEVIIPDGVVTIGYEAFYQNKDIEKVVIPDSVKIISQSAFSFCENLREVKLPQSLYFIGDGAFGYCKSLERISIPDSVTYIGSHAFMDCESLINIKLPSGLERLEDAVLCGCESLPSVEIPSSVRIICDSAFIRCKSFVSVDIPFGVEVIGGSAFTLCGSLRYVYIPDSVHVIGGMAFYNCNELEQVRLPSSVYYIGYNAFPESTRYSMRRYGYIEECMTADPSLSAHVLTQSEMARATALGLDVDERGVLYKYQGQQTVVDIPEFVKAIAVEAFYNNPGIEEVRVPSSVEFLDRHVFSHSVNLRKVVFECSWAQFGSDIFHDCSSLETIDLPAELEVVPECAFWGCKSLKTINLPATLQVIGDHAFFDCGSLESLELPNSLLGVNVDAFVNCTSLASVVFPDSISHLGFRCFTGCPNLKEVSVPSKLFIHDERLSPFDKGVKVRTFATNWAPETKAPVERNVLQGNASPWRRDDHDSEEKYTPTTKSSEYSLLMKSIAFIAQAASSAGEVMRSIGLGDVESIISDLEYELDACGQMMFAVLSNQEMPFLQPGVHSHGAAANEQPFSYREYKRAFTDNALIPYDAKVGDVVKLLNTHLATAFQEAVIAFQYALSTDQPNIEIFKGRGRSGDGVIRKIAYAKSHFMSEYISLASPTTLMLIPSDGIDFVSTGPFSLCDMEINEMVKCMMPGDLDRMMNVDTHETPITPYMTVGVANSNYTAVPAGSKEVDDYIEGSISAWLENVY